MIRLGVPCHGFGPVEPLGFASARPSRFHARIGLAGLGLRPFRQPRLMRPARSPRPPAGSPTAVSRPGHVGPGPIGEGRQGLAHGRHGPPGSCVRLDRRRSPAGRAGPPRGRPGARGSRPTYRRKAETLASVHASKPKAALARNLWCFKQRESIAGADATI